MREKIAKLILVTGFLIFLGGISMQLFVKEASYLRQDQLKQRMLSYLNDNGLIEPAKVLTVTVDDRRLSFSQPSAQSIQRFYLVIEPTEVELKSARDFARELEENGGKYGFIEFDGFMLIHDLYSERAMSLLRSFPYDSYPIDTEIVSSFLQKLATTPAEEIRQSSAHLFYDVVFLIPKVLFYLVATPFRQLSAFLFAINPNAAAILSTPLVPTIGLLISIFTYRFTFPRNHR